MYHCSFIELTAVRVSHRLKFFTSIYLQVVVLVKKSLPRTNIGGSLNKFKKFFLLKERASTR